MSVHLTPGTVPQGRTCKPQGGQVLEVTQTQEKHKQHKELNPPLGGETNHHLSGNGGWGPINTYEYSL